MKHIQIKKGIIFRKFSIIHNPLDLDVNMTNVVNFFTKRGDINYMNSVI